MSTTALTVITWQWSVQSGQPCLFWSCWFGFVCLFFFFWHIEKDKILPLCSPSFPTADTVRREEKPWPSGEAHVAHKDRTQLGHHPCPQLVNKGPSLAGCPGHWPRRRPAGKLDSTHGTAQAPSLGGWGQPGAQPRQHGRPAERRQSAQCKARCGGDEVLSSLLRADRKEATVGIR